MSVLIFLAVIFVLVLVHEWGHFIVAKKTGMRVDEFGIGFPPKLFSWRKGETEYTFNLFPIGGFVRIFGENSADAEFSPVSSVDETPDAKLDAEPGRGGTQPQRSRHPDYARSFTAKTPLQQSAVLVAGVVMNMLFAWFLFVLVYTLGFPSVVDEANATENARLVIAEVLPNTPAAAAGIERGAVIQEVFVADELQSAATISEFQAIVGQVSEGERVTINYTQAGVAATATIAPAAGVVESSETPAIGVALAMIDTVQAPLHIALWEGTIRTWDTLVAVTVGLSTLIVDAVLGQADLSTIAGPIGIVGLVDEAAQFGFVSLLLFTALISVNLAVINMLPFPALDGGRLLFVAIEVIKGSPINPEWVARLNTAGFFLLIFLMIAVTWSDVSKLLG